MRRQASRSLWPYCGLLLCLLVMSLAAPHSWYVAERGELQQDPARPNSEPVSPAEGPRLFLNPSSVDPPRSEFSRGAVTTSSPESGSQAMTAAGPLPNKGAVSPRLVAERLAALIDLVDEVALPSLPRFIPLPPAVPLPLSVGERPLGQRAAQNERENPAAVVALQPADAAPPEPSEQTTGAGAPELGDSPSDPLRAADESMPVAGMSRGGETRSPEQFTQPEGPEERSVLVQRTPVDRNSTSDGTGETFSSPAALDPGTGEVRIGDAGDRLAVRLRPFRRLVQGDRAAGGRPATDGAAAAEELPWLAVEPTSLLVRLEILEKSTASRIAGWANGIRTEIEQLCRESTSNRAETAARFAELSRLVDAAKSMEQHLPQEERNAVQLTRAAVIRRVAVWNSLIGVTCGPAEWELLGDQLVRAVEDAQTGIEATPQGRSWAEYLLLGEIMELWRTSPERSDKHLRQLIEQLADRWESPQLTASQRALLAEEPFATLRRRFGDWAAATVDLQTLCKAIEAQEARGGEVYARRIAADARLLALASAPASARVAETIDRYYRNSNLRVAVSREFLQRLIPKQPATLEPVRERIAGAAVAGQSLTESDVRVVLVPDPQRWRIGLEVTGNVAAQTASTSGPATFHSAARTEYVARKLLVLSSAGLHTFPAVAGAAADNMLQGLETSFDGIPLVEGLVRSIVINQHDLSRRQALAEVESRVSSRARQRLDSELDQRLQQAAGRVRENIWTPLVELDFAPDDLELETTSERLVGACRLAADRQLAAHTPRPYALADSLLSMQIHHSVLNNLVERLDLNDRECTLAELYQQVAGKLGRDAVTIPEDLSPTARIHFARFDPIAVAIEDGRVRITLSLDAVKDGRHRFYDFKVHAFYRPQVNGLHAQLVRDGIVEIEGRDLRPGDYIVLQGVFVSLFSESRPLTVVPADRNDDPRLAGLMITQLVLEEGWLGVAIGPGHPRRTALMSRIVR